MTYKSFASQSASPGAATTTHQSTKGMNRLLLWAVLIVMAIWTGLQFMGMGAGGSFEFWGIGRATGAIEILLVLSIMLNLPQLRKPSATTIAVLCWIPWVFANVAVSVPGDLGEWLHSGAMPALLWPLVYLFFYTHAKRDAKSFQLLQRYFLVLSISCGALFFQVFQVVNAGRTTGLLQLNAVYYPLLTIQWAAVARKLSWRIGAVAGIALAVFFSLKRGAILALALGGAGYVLVGAILSTGAHRLRWILSLSAVAVIFLAAYSRVDESLGGACAERLIGMRDDGGSGRSTIYMSVLDALSDADPENLLLGHGHDSTLERFGITAHNDFLEVTFDYGIIGLVLYVWLHFCLLRKTYALIRARSPHAPAFGAAYAVFLVMSMTSHLIIYPTYFAYMAAFWGTIEGMTREGVQRGRQLHA